MLPDLDLSTAQWLLASGIVFAGTVVQGSLGFGLGTLGVPLLLLIYPGFVPAPMLLVAFVLTVTVYLRERGEVTSGDIGWGIGGRVIGAALGAALVRMVADDMLAVVAAGLVLVALGLVQSGIHLPVNRRNLVVAGTLSGLMGTAASIGGPPMAMLYSRERGPRVRGTLSGIFIAGTLTALFALWTVGRFGLRELQLGAALLPACLAGLLASRYVATFLDRGFVRPAIFTVSAAAALFILGQRFL